MFTYSYKARDGSGRITAGTVEAPTQDEALRLLQQEGKTITEIRVGTRDPAESTAQLRYSASQVKREEVIVFASQLAVMLETGVPLGEALEAFQEQTKSVHMKRVIDVVADRVISGVAFSSAMAEFPKVFPPLMISLMQASEASGTMGMMLARISEYLGNERRTIRQIRGALTYPFIMATFATGVTIMLVTWVLPRFARLYESREAALPVATRVVMRISEFMGMYWMYMLGGFAAVVLVGYLTRRSGKGARVTDWLKLHVLVIGPIFRNFYLTRATRTLGTLLNSGVGLLDAVRIVRGVTRNGYWDELWEKMEHSITTGQTVTDVVMDSTLFPASVSQMVSAGERTGRLPAVLEKIADATEQDLDDAIKQGTQLIEPAMIIFMGATIGGIAIALLLPIFNVSSIMGH